MAIRKLRREGSGEPKSANTLILDLSASRTVRNKFLLFKPPSQWYFVMAAQQTNTRGDLNSILFTPYISGPQHFWHQGPVSWKTILPWMGWGRGGGDSGSDASDGEQWGVLDEASPHLLLCSPVPNRPQPGGGPQPGGVGTPCLTLLPVNLPQFSFQQRRCPKGF